MKDYFEYVKNVDYEKFSEMNSIKRTLKSCIDMKKLISKIKEIIKESKDFDFRSNRAERFIDEKSPTFILSCNLLATKKELKEKNIDLTKLTPSKLSELTDNITKLVNMQITEKISEFLTECVLDEEKYNNLFENLPEEFSSTLLTQIYIIRVSVADNSVVLKIFN